MPRWTREPDADQRIKQLLASRLASIKAGKMLQSPTALTQIHCAGDSTANINLTKSRILTSSDYYLLQNLQSCDSVYTLQSFGDCI